MKLEKLFKSGAMKTVWTFLVALALMHGNAFAQSFSIDWHKIAGGGGISSNGGYTLVGTIGQHDTGKMSGGSYTLEGGFLGGLVLIQTPGSPMLSIQLAGSNATISWAADASVGFVLQEALNLNSPASWIDSALTVTTNNGVKSVTVPASSVKFFRLQKP